MIDYHAILPEIILAVTVLAVLATDLVTREKFYGAIVGLVGLFASFVPLFTLAICDDLSFCTGTLPRELFGGSYVVDQYALVLKGLFLASAFVVILLSVAYLESDRYYEGEYYFLLLSAVLGAVVMASSRDFITMIVGLELVSGPGFLLAGWRKADEKSNEAALKFFIIGVVAFALLVMGVSLLYGISGTQLFSELAVVPQSIADEPVFVLGMLFVFLGFAFKISAVPFHVWTPDVYEGSPTPVTAWLSVGSKGAGFVGVLTVAYLAFPDQSAVWGPLLWLLAALSMTLGNLVAIKQTNIVRLLGYSSIAQAGFMLAPFGAAAAAGADLQEAFAATVAYLLIYAVMNLGAFGVVIAVGARVKSYELADWGGMYRWAPALAVLLSLFFMSLAGIPPLAGWFAKLAMFSATISVESPWGYSIAIIAAVNAVVAFVYYSKVVKSVMFDPVPDLIDPDRLGGMKLAPTLGFALGVTTVLVLVLGVFPGVIANLSKFTAEVLATGF
ncbi:MAG: NADH-quinone oxidoreductase subunit N [Acidimicrobiia bacterium]